MTGNRAVLDTNVIIDHLDEKPDAFTAVGNLSQIFLPVIVAGELYVGIYRSLPKLKQNKADKIEKFITTSFILEINKETSNIYARIKAELFKKGRPIPENDIWIAATSIQNNLPLYTFDKHFKEVDGLQLFNPLTSI